MSTGPAIKEESGLAELRASALAAARRHAEGALTERPFVASETPVPVGGRVLGPPEIEALVEASLDG